jgi:hypothetical protein
MALNLSLIKNRLNSLSNASQKTNYTWKPNPGKQVLRIVPYKFQPDNPFIELKFHYGINNKTYLSPDSFNRPDPIVEFSNRMKKTGNKEDWQVGRKMEPKMRTYVPVLVRGEEDQGVRFWGFGKTVYQEILGYIADPDYGDITDPNEGRDIVVEIVSAEDSGTSYPVTTIRVKPKESALTDSKETTDKFLNEQKNITELYSELSYAELKNVLESWLNPSAGGDDESVESTSTEELSKVAPSAKTESHDMGGSTAAPKAAEAPAKKLDDVAAAFDDLFNS